MTFSEGIGAVPSSLARELAGHPIHRQVLLQASERLRTTPGQELSEAEQIVELYNITRTADRIEEHFTSNGIALPHVYSIHTAGFPLPFDEEHRLPLFHQNKEKPDTYDPFSDGSYGKPPFELFARPDILGHAGQVSVGRVGESVYMAFQGRAHPYEWTHDPNGELKVGRILNVIKELVRRQRERGENPVVFISFLSGVYEQSPLVPGDIGILIDDTEKGVPFHPGMGPHKILEQYLGSRFQPKLGRVATPLLAREFMALAEEMGIRTGPASIIGTPTSTEYQSAQEIAEAVNGFKTSRRIILDELSRAVIPLRGASDAVRTIFNRRWHSPSLLFGMGNTFELAVMRQTITRTQRDTLLQETDFPLLPLALVTDSVGRRSMKTDHAQIVQTAFGTADRNAALIRRFVEKIARGEIEYPTPNRHMQTSLQATLPK